MPDGDLAALGERLVRAGIAPRHARRLVTELESHYQDLVEEETARGQPMVLARSTARARLGTDDEILMKALEQPALRSWGARWPLRICGIAPVFGLAASFVAILLALAVVVSPGRHPGAARPTSAEVAPWIHHTAVLAGWLLLYGLPVVWGAILVRYAVTRRLRWIWPLSGLVLTAALGAATNMSVTWPKAGTRGQMSAGVGIGTSWEALTTFGLRSLVTVTMGLLLYALLTRRANSGHRA